MQRPVILLAAALAVSPVGASAQDGPFLAKEGPDLWRASKLVGVDVLGPDGTKVGGVTDVLLDHDGRAVDVVIGVGGFLGIGQKDVALPFAAVHFTDAPRPGAKAGAAPNGNTLASDGGMAGGGKPDGAPAAALGGPVGTTTGVPGGQATGLAATPDAPPGGTAAPARSTARPNHAVVDLTAGQLKSAPAFAFAP